MFARDFIKFTDDSFNIFFLKLFHFCSYDAADAYQVVQLIVVEHPEAS